MIQFLNIACVLIFADFSLGYASESTGFKVLMGKYRDFDTKWYYDVGAKISMAMISNSIAPFCAKLFEPILLIALRFLDRGFEKHLRKITNIEEKKAEEERKFREQAKKDRAKGKSTAAAAQGESAENLDEEELEKEGGDDYGDELEEPEGPEGDENTAGEPKTADGGTTPVGDEMPGRDVPETKIIF